MNQFTKHPLFWITTGFIIALGALIVSLFQTQPIQEPLTEAYQSYSSGEQAKTVADRKKAFNKALDLYSQVEAKYKDDGRLYYDIGNTYFQLGEYPMAIYNYYRAQALRPNDEKIKQNLKTALDKAGIKDEDQGSVFEQIFYPHFHLSLADRLRSFFFSGLVLLAAISAYIWYKQKWLWNLIILAGLVCFFFFCSTLYTRFIAPLQGVMVQSALLYRDAGTEYAKVKDEPVAGGSKVDVIEVSKDGEWLKVMTRDGTLGYVQQKAIRLL